MRGFPRLYAAASLKQPDAERHQHLQPGFPRLYAAASLKRVGGADVVPQPPGFPRLYAAASLKRGPPCTVASVPGTFSAALCRGLIEARNLYSRNVRVVVVFRGFMPRPH